MYFRPLLALRKLLSIGSIPDLWQHVYQEFLSRKASTGFLFRVVESFQPSPNCIVCRLHCAFPVLLSPFQRFREVLEEDWLRHISGALVDRAQAHELAHSRFDIVLTTELLKVFPDSLRSDLESVLGASHHYRVCQLPQVARQGRDDKVCPLCGSFSEGPQHVWLTCSHEAIQEIRSQHSRLASFVFSAPSFPGVWLVAGIRVA